MKFTIKFILTLALLFMAISYCLVPSQAEAQQLVQKDSTYYGDTTVTFNVAGYEELYVDVYNSNADSTNAIAFFGTNFSSWDIALGVIDQTSSYNWSTVSTVATVASSKKTYRVNSNGWQYLKIINNDMNGVDNKVYYEVRGIRKTQF